MSRPKTDDRRPCLLLSGQAPTQPCSLFPTMANRDQACDLRFCHAFASYHPNANSHLTLFKVLLLNTQHADAKSLQRCGLTHGLATRSMHGPWPGERALKLRAVCIM